MKFISILLLISTSIRKKTNAFIVPINRFQSSFSTSLFSSHQLFYSKGQSDATKLRMSDFASAMPEQTFEDKMNNSADKYLFEIRENLGEDVPPPPELEALSKARENGADAKEIATKTYELMIEQGMLYDVDENNVLTPTQYDIKNNLEVPEVKSEFKRLYEYGMSLAQNGLIGVETVKEIVVKRLIERTGLTPEEFDKWLGYY